MRVDIYWIGEYGIKKIINLPGFLLVMAVLMSEYAHASETSGEQVYIQNCMVCHGDDGSGAMPGVPDLRANRSWMAVPAQQLIKHIKQGIQSPGAAVTMPPKGGNPALSDEELSAVIDYMRKDLF